MGLLNVNIDHVATVRQAQGKLRSDKQSRMTPFANYPDIFALGKS
jgi:pyridoxine 5'-phosphate synthase PdxJ